MPTATVQNIWTLTGDEFQAGNAYNSTQTDQFTVYGSGNYILSIGGNLIVNGGSLAPYGQDTGTTIYLSADSVGQSPAPQVGVTDSITLDGGDNSLYGEVKLSKATVSMTVNGSAGDNTVDLDNYRGTTTLKLGGPDNVVMLNGDAINNITSTGGGASIYVGSSYDDMFTGYSMPASMETTITLGGTGNYVMGGDENFTISGGQGQVYLGDGTDSVTMTGSSNTMSVGGGNDSINAGGSNALVEILGLDGAAAASMVPEKDDPGVPSSPTDNVTIAGSYDVIKATYENVNVLGASVVAYAAITLGNGNNNVILGGSGDDAVKVGNGSNGINVSGSSNTIDVGNGANGITLSGNSNLVQVADLTGVGKDIMQLGSGANDTVNFESAGGSVAGTATTGVTTVTQSTSSAQVVNVNLLNGTGAITLGNGSDTIVANGAGTIISAGNGNDSVTANGAKDKIALGNGSDTIVAAGGSDVIGAGNGSDTVTANGAKDTITLGNGPDVLTANGASDQLALGNGSDLVNANGNTDTITIGSGNDNITALGSGDMITVNSSVSSSDTLSVGASSTVSITDGTDAITANGASDTFYLNGQNWGTTVAAYGNADKIFLGSNASGLINLNPSGLGEQITVQALGTNDQYSGTIEITGFGSTDSIDLQGLGFTSFGQVLTAMTFGPTGDTLHLAGGGSIIFESPVAFTPSEFGFSTTHGAVGAAIA